jgi:hypothetical protein
MLLAVMCASAAPTRLLTATFTGDCDSFTIMVTGEGLNEPDAIVSYNIKLTPRSGGEPMTIVDSFPVTPEQDGSFHKTITQSWKKFEYRLAGKYTLSGSALLASSLIPIHDIAIKFPRPKLNCGRRLSVILFAEE